MHMTDKYGEADFEIVPTGPRKGDRWVDVPALTLHAILSSQEFGLTDLDERRVIAIREGLREKDEARKSVVGDRRPDQGSTGSNPVVAREE
jgi:hypothetical protein